MPIKAVVLVLFCFIQTHLYSKAVVLNSATAFEFNTPSPKPIHHLKLKKTKKTGVSSLLLKENKKWAALLITVFLGMLGAHRLYLGTKPWIPAIYLFTFGGGFLILPIIDFFVLLFAKDLEPYLNNSNFFMWIK